MFSTPLQRMRVIGSAVLLLLTLGAMPLTAADARDPLLPVKPRSRPQIRNLLSPAEFEERSAPFTEKIEELKKAPNQHAPAFGLRVEAIFPDGWAAKNGIAVGDVISQVAGERIWGDGLPEFAETTPIQVYVTATDKLRTVRVDADKFDVWLATYWHPENLYLGSNRQGARWDDQLLLAILARGTDPDLAETALNKVIDAGYRADVVADQVAAEIALCQNRPDVAADFSSFVNWNSKTDSEEIYPLLLYRVAMANYHWQRAHEIVMRGRDQLDSLSPIGPVRLVEMHQARPAAARTLPPPSQRLEQTRRIDLTDRIQGSNRSAIENRQRDLRDGKPLQISSPTAHFTTIAFETPEPISNLEFSIRFSAKPTDELVDRYLKWFIVRVTAITPPGEENTDLYFDPRLTMFAITEWGNVRVGCGGGYSEAYFTDPTVETLDNREHEFRLLRFGGQIELFLNGHRILYAPAPEGPYPIQFEVTATGTTVDVHAIRLAEYVEPL